MQGQRHGLVPVLVSAQLFPIARRQQQGVVGARTEDEHGQDARALRVDGDHVVLREQVDDPLGCAQRDERGEQREDPQHRAAVGQQQEDDDDDAGGDQQPAVDALEGGREVTVDAGRSGHLDRQTVVVRFGAEVVAHVGDDVGECVPTRLTDVDRDEHLHRLAVLGHDRSRDLVGDDVLDVLDLVDLLRGELAVGIGDAAGALVDDDRGQHVDVVELLLLREVLRRLGAGREPGRCLVVLDAGELAGQRTEDRDAPRSRRRR